MQARGAKTLLDGTDLAPFPALVLSDLHFGHPATRVTDPLQLRPVLEGFRSVILNGDSYEMTNLRCRRSGYDRLQRLIEYCRSQGQKVVLLTGNHDPGVSNLHELDWGSGQVYLTHGDMLHPRIAPWSKEADLIWSERQRLEALWGPPRSVEEDFFVGKASCRVACLYDNKRQGKIGATYDVLERFLKKPRRIAMCMHYWSTVPRLAQRLLETHRPNARLMLIGHTHKAGVWKLPTATLVNTGSYSPLSRPLAVRLERRQAAVYKIVRRHDEYRLAVAHSTIELNAAPQSVPVPALANP